MRAGMAKLVDQNSAVFNVLGTSCLAGNVWLSVSAGQAQLSAPPFTLNQVPPSPPPLTIPLPTLHSVLFYGISRVNPVSRATLCSKSTEIAHVHRFWCVEGYSPNGRI